MKNQILGTKNQRPLNLPAKRLDTLLRYFVRLAANVHQVAGMNHKRPHVQRRSQLTHSMSLPGINLGRTPHPRARRKNLKSIGADLPRPLHSVRRPARRPQMHSNSPAHADSLNGPTLIAVILRALRSPRTRLACNNS